MEKQQEQEMTPEQKKAAFMHNEFMEAMNRIHKEYPDVLTPELSNAMLMLSLAMNNGIIEGHRMAQAQAQAPAAEEA
jgi:hypothetical protein